MKSLHAYLERIKEQKYPLRFIASKILWTTRVCTFLECRSENYVIKFHPASLSAALWVDPRDRFEDEEFFRFYLRQDDCVVDVGANIGHLTLVAASIVGPQGRVYSIEPHPRTFRFLEENILLNRFANVKAFNVALGAKSSTVTFSDLRADDENYVCSGEQGITVKMVTLDDFLVSEPEVQLLKIDVEGYEKFVLLGATKTLERILCVYFESWDQHFLRYGYTCGDVLEFLIEKGFHVFRKTNRRVLLPVDRRHASAIGENLIAVRFPERFFERTHFRLGS